MVSNEKMELDLSLGGVTWWGFSPWTPLTGDKILVIGAGDPRHLVKTMAQSDSSKMTEFYMLEQSVNVYCRQMLMLQLLNESHIDPKTRANMFLELLGNSLITEQTDEWIRKTSAKFAKIIGSNNDNILESSWDLSLLKDKEKDSMEEIFKQWRDGHQDRKKMIEYWILRHQKLLGERFEQREGVAETDYHMKMVERGGANVNKKDFVRWRSNGIAFKVTEDENDTKNLVDNVTLISGDQKTSGYWGDIMSGPFICYEDEPNYEWSLQDQNQAINVEDASKVIKRVEEAISIIDETGGIKNTKFIPLSVSSSSKLNKILKSRGNMNSIWVGLSVSHYIDESLASILSEEGTLIVETPLYLLLVSKDILESFQTKVSELALSAGLEVEETNFDLMKTFSVSMIKKVSCENK